MFDENKLQTFLKKQAVFLCIMPKENRSVKPSEFPDKPDFFPVRHRKFPVIQVLKTACWCCELKPQLVGIQLLSVVARRAVHLVASVLSIAQKRVSDMREMRADLVCASGEQIHLHKALLCGFLQHPVLCLYCAV